MSLTIMLHSLHGWYSLNLVKSLLSVSGKNKIQMYIHDVRQSQCTQTDSNKSLKWRKNSFAIGRDNWNPTHLICKQGVVFRYNKIW